jgi:hypothetical protein
LTYTKSHMVSLLKTRIALPRADCTRTRALYVIFPYPPFSTLLISNQAKSRPVVKIPTTPNPLHRQSPPVNSVNSAKVVDRKMGTIRPINLIHRTTTLSESLLPNVHLSYAPRAKKMRSSG